MSERRNTTRKVGQIKNIMILENVNMNGSGSLMSENVE
jgi:hypothetical protein